MADGSDRIVVAAADAHRSAGLVRRLTRAGFRPEEARTLQGALAVSPALLILDPAGLCDDLRAHIHHRPQSLTPPPGLLFATEEEDSSQLPGSAFATLSEALSDEELRARIERALSRRANFADHWPDMLVWREEGGFLRIVELVEARGGFDLRIDRREVLRDAVRARLVATLSASFDDYVNTLLGPAGERELDNLASAVTVGETHFWRYAGQMKALENLLVRRYRASKRPVRIWCGGSSTGEEPYSVAIAAATALGLSADFTIYGGDINATALMSAKACVYGERSVRNLPPEHLARWFDAEGPSSYRIREELKQKVHFRVQNLTTAETERWAEATGPFDAIFCRNVLIYFGKAASARLLSLFLRSLAQGGGLFLGSAETISARMEWLDVVHEAGAFFYRKRENPAPPMVREPPSPPPPPEPDWVAPLFRKGLNALDAEDFDAALDTFHAILMREPLSSRGNTGMALALASLGREGEARERVGIALGGATPHVETYHVAALLAERAGDDAAALEFYSRSLEYEADFVMSRYNRAWIWHRLGKMAEFKREMTTVLYLLGRVRPPPLWATGGLAGEAIRESASDALRLADDKA